MKRIKKEKAILKQFSNIQRLTAHENIFIMAQEWCCLGAGKESTGRTEEKIMKTSLQHSFLSLQPLKMPSASLELKTLVLPVVTMGDNGLLSVIEVCIYMMGYRI